MRVLIIGAGGVDRPWFELRTVDLFERWWSRTTTSRGRNAPSWVLVIDLVRTSSTAATKRHRRVDHVREGRRRRQRARSALRHAGLSRAFTAGVTYLDMAMSLSHPHPTDPYALTGVKLGDEQFCHAGSVKERGCWRCAASASSPVSRRLRRYGGQAFFVHRRIGVRDGANLVVEGYEFAPSFSIWTTIEECLNPPVIWERGRTGSPPRRSASRDLQFPGRHRPVECVNVEARGGLLMPRWLEANRVTFKYGLGDEFIQVLSTLHKLGLDSITPVRLARRRSRHETWWRPVSQSRELGDRMSGLTCAGTWVRGAALTARARGVLYHVVDNAWTMSEFDSQSVVWQTAMNPISRWSSWSRVRGGRRGPGSEALAAEPFLDLVNSHGSPWGCDERTPSKK